MVNSSLPRTLTDLIDAMTNILVCLQEFSRPASAVNGYRRAFPSPVSGDHTRWCRPAWYGARRRVVPAKTHDVGQKSTRPPPCMRWREPCLGLAAPRRPVPRPPRRRAPPASARHPCDKPVSRSILTSRGCPQLVPVPTMKAFLRPLRVVAQVSAAIHFKFLPHPQDVHRTKSLIRTTRQLSTGL